MFVRKFWKKLPNFEETSYAYSFSKTLSEIFGKFYKKTGMILNNLSYLSIDNFWGRSCFLIDSFKSFRILSEIVWSFEKITLLIGNTFFRVSRGLSERTNFHQYFFQKAFRTSRKSFQTFGVLLIGRAFNRSNFFCQRNFVTRDNFIKVNEIAIKNFWPPTVSFLEFWRKRFAGFLEFN